MGALQQNFIYHIDRCACLNETRIQSIDEICIHTDNVSLMFPFIMSFGLNKAPIKAKTCLLIK